MRGGLWLWTLAAACGTTPAPSNPPDSLTTAPYVPGGASSADAAESQAVEALLAALTPALDSCASAQTEAEATIAACAEAGAAHDRVLPTLGGRSRATDTLLGHLARLADDLDYLRRAQASDTVEQANALHHVHDAVTAAREAAGRWRGESHDTYAGSAALAVARPSDWERMVDSDVSAAHELRPMLHRLCFNQGVKDPRQVRARMLAAVSRPAKAEREARARALATAAVSPEERAQREAWLAAQRALFDTFDDLVERFRSGQITTTALKAEQEARIDAALAAFDAAATAWRAAHPR